MPRRDRVVDGGEHVLHVDVAPVGVDRGLELLAPSGAAARVRREDDVAVGGEPVPLLVERALELADRPAVDAEDRRVALPGLEVRRLDEETVDLGAVLALELRLFDRAEAHLREPGVVLLRQPPRLRCLLDRVDLVGEHRRAPSGSRRGRPAAIEKSRDDPPARRRAARSRRRPRGSRARPTAWSSSSVKRIAAPSAVNCGDRTFRSTAGGQDPRRAAGRRHDGEAVEAVVDELVRARPGRRRSTSSRDSRRGGCPSRARCRRARRVVSCRGTAPGRGSIAQMSQLSVRSASAMRLETNAIVLPSGDQAGRSSS